MIENMDKGLTVPKWVLIVQQKIPQTLPKCSAQFVCPSTKVWDFFKRKLSLGVRSPYSGSSYSTRSKSSRRKTTKTGSKCWVVFIIAKRKTTTYVGKVCKSVCFRKIFFRRLHNWLVAATWHHY